MAGGGTHLHDLPEAILIQVARLVEDTRARNAMALVCRRWRQLERATRSALCLRGNVRDLFLPPTCFSAVARLDVSHLSPWGHPLLPPAAAADDDQDPHLIACLLRQAFPNLDSLTVYARYPSTLQLLAPQWPGLRQAKLVRWHQRPHHRLGDDLAPLLAACPSLASLDLSQFYCWTEDIPPALKTYPATAASLTSLDLLGAVSSEGFKASELRAISNACPKLRRLRAPCVFNPRCMDFVGDDALLAVAANCPGLALLHFADPSAAASAAAGGPPNPNADGFAPADAGVTAAGLEALFALLPLLEDLALDLCQNVRDAGPALEVLSSRCPRIRALKLGYFHGVCRAAGLHLDGIAVCGKLESLSLKNSADLSDQSLVAIARGCSRLSKFEIHGCRRVTEAGLRKMAGMLRSTLTDVGISRCERLDTVGSLRALEPVRGRIRRLHVDCVWVGNEVEWLGDGSGRADDESDFDELEQESAMVVTEGDNNYDADYIAEAVSESKNKKCRHLEAAELTCNSHWSHGSWGFWGREWEQLRYLSLWVPAGEVLTPLADAGLESCPELEEICIKVEGDCRKCPRPTQGEAFGLSSLACYPKLSKMKLDCGDAVGYALTAPPAQMDLSLWERFYLHGIGDLRLYELDYWPPQDREVNQRSVFLPAAALLQGCVTLRKLFVHGTTNEHFMRFFLAMPNLRDVQLREDYYPAPETDMSTEMRVDSCSRFEDALNRRPIPD